MTSSVLIIGKPNSGKSLLFNKLTGLAQKVANFPGVTVEVKQGYLKDIAIRDFPGIYSLNPMTKDEEIAVERLHKAIHEDHLSGILCILDVTRLERSLFLALQMRELARKHGKAIYFAANMMDEIQRNKLSIDLKSLEKELGHKVFGISAKSGAGLKELEQALCELVENPTQAAVALAGTSSADDDLKSLAKDLSRKYAPNTEVLLRGQTRLDEFFLSGWLGGLVFAGIMLFLFQSIFTWSEPAMNFIEDAIGWVSSVVTPILPAGLVSDFVNDALLGGIGSFVIFVPQIFVLTFIIGVLEDSGYLARAAIICHKPLSFFGLSGRSFVALLSGHACSIPAIFAARTIESPKKRMLTLAAIPLMACAARLPVYSLLVAVLIPPVTFLGGAFGYRGLAFFALYLFSLLSALIIAGILSRTMYKKTSDAPFVIELPPYRLPALIPLVRRAAQSAWAFIVKAGFVIFCVTVVVWVLGYFPNGSGELSSSWLAKMGQWIEPIFAPLGLDWKYGVAILASFLAREVFVGTLGTLFGIEGADEDLPSLVDSMSASGFTLASGAALLVFYAIALQCVSTVAILRKETGNDKFALGLLAGYGALAYILALIAYQIVRLF